MDDDWNYSGHEALDPLQMIVVQGRMGDEYGPIPVGLIRPEAWEGNMPNYSLDLYRWRLARVSYV